MDIRHSLVASLTLVAALESFAAIEVARPLDGSQVRLLPDEQRQVLAIERYADRLALFQCDLENGKKLRHADAWRKSKPLVYKWKATAGEKGPWEFRISKNPDMSDARIELIGSTADPDKNGFSRFTLPYANYEVGTTYYWQLRSDAACRKWAHGDICACTNRPQSSFTKVMSFTTEDLAPRWIVIEGRTQNIRDLGGRKTDDGRRVRQGMIYRGQGLNDNSVNGRIQGRNRLTVEDVKYLTEILGIKTDLDLRSKTEIADLKESPLGKGVKFVHHSSKSYMKIFKPEAMKVMADNFRLFCDEANYPIYFHCIAGADRTGSLGYILNSVLGVCRREVETDWESTFYPRELPEMREGYKKEKNKKEFWCLESHFDDGLAKYGKEGDSLKRRAELYLLDCGVTEEEISKFRSIMLK